MISMSLRTELTLFMINTVVVSLSLSDTRLYFGSPTVKLSLSELSECQPKEVCDEGMEWNVKCGCLVLCQLKLSVVKN